MKYPIYLFLILSQLALGQQNLPNHLLLDSKLAPCGISVSSNSGDTISLFCFDNKLFNGYTIGFMDEDDDYLCIRGYSSGMLSYYVIYNDFGYIAGDQGFDGYGDEIYSWGNQDPCEELEPFNYFEYWDNGNLKEHGIRWCGENFFFKYEYHESGNVRKISYFEPSYLFKESIVDVDSIYNLNRNIFFDENCNIISTKD